MRRVFSVLLVWFMLAAFTLPLIPEVGAAAKTFGNTEVVDWNAKVALEAYGQDGYDYKTDDTPYVFYVKANSAWGDGAKYSVTYNGTAYSLVYQSQDYSYRDIYGSQDYITSITNTAGTIADNTITYNNTYPNVDLQYTTYKGMVKENYVIRQLPRSPATYLTAPVTLDFGGYIKYAPLKMYVDGVEKTGNFVTNKRIDFGLTNTTILFFLPAPYAIDSAGNTTTCQYEVKVSGQQIWFYVRTPYTWLSNPARVFPVTVDPTFGYTSIGAYGDIISNVIRGSVFTMPEYGNAISITAAVGYSGPAPGETATLKAAIYKHSDLSLVATSIEQTDISLSWISASWVTFTFSSPPTLQSGIDYMLVVWATQTSSSSNVFLAYTSGSTNQGHYQSSTYTGTFPDPLVPSHDNNKYSVYVTYTPTGAPDTTPPTYSTAGHTGVTAGSTVTFYAYFSDNVALSHYIFSTNNTGSWVNDTAVAFASTPGWGNVSKTLTETVGAVVQYRWYWNDTSGNWGDMTVKSLTTVGSSAPYTYVFHGPYLDSGTVYNGYVNCTITLSSGTESFTLDGTSGSADSETKQYNQQALLVSWNITAGTNYTRVHYFTGASFEEVNIYIPDPELPVGLYTFTVTDFRGITNGYLQVLVQQGTDLTLLAQRKIDSVNPIPFYLTWGQTYYLRVTCDLGTLDLGTFTALSQENTNLIIPYDAFPVTYYGLNVTCVAKRQSATWIQMNYTDHASLTSWVYMEIEHKANGVYVTDYTDNATGNTVTSSWYGADQDTDYRVTVTSLRDGTEQVWVFSCPHVPDDANPWGPLDEWGDSLPFQPRYIVGFCVVLAVAMIFSYWHVVAGGFATLAAAGFLNYFGWLNINWTFIALGGAIVVMIAFAEFRRSHPS